MKGILPVLMLLVPTPGCSGSLDEDLTQTLVLRPPRLEFESMADALQPSCGTLDCHGQASRNLRLFGERGLRLENTLREKGTESSTSTEEYDATYLSLVGLEPELLHVVIRDRGERPERLSLIRKARNTEVHKGGALMKRGDNLDRCMLTWITGRIRADICAQVTLTQRPTPRL